MQYDKVSVNYVSDTIGSQRKRMINSEGEGWLERTLLTYDMGVGV